MATFIQLQQRIASELGDKTKLIAPAAGTTIWSPIKNAIQSAVAKWEREPFYFNEFYDAAFFNTVNAQEFYTSADTTKISTVVSILRLRATISGSRYTLVPRRWTYLDDISTGTTTGKPEEFAYFAQQIRLYPIPDGAYAVAASGTKRLTTLSADADTNGWTTDGFDLIRAEAMWIIATEYLRDAAVAGAMEIAIYGNPENPSARGYLAALKDETNSRARPNIMRAAGDPPRGG